MRRGTLRRLGAPVGAGGVCLPRSLLFLLAGGPCPSSLAAVLVVVVHRVPWASLSELRVVGPWPVVAACQHVT